MKAKIFLLTVITIIVTNMNLQAQSSSKKILVVYFSHSGNTRIIAEYIQEATSADIFEIEPVKDYPQNYQAVVDQAKKEINDNYKPELKTKVQDIKQYDVIFVGSPNWWGTVAPPVSTFLSSYDLSGKTIIPFITHEGSRMGRSVADIKKLCPGSDVLSGYSCYGSKVGNARSEVDTWVKEINMTK